MSKKLDIIGQRFGKLVVTKMIYNEKNKNFSHCECICDCDNTTIKNCYTIRHSKQEPSCGCNNREYMIKRFSKDIDGKKFGKLLVLQSIWDCEKPQVKCKCDCGNIAILDRCSVLSGHTKSCGCLQKEVMHEIRKTDDTGYISDFGVEILSPYKRNKNNQLLWNCKCGFCGKKFAELPARIKNNHTRSCGCLISSSMEKYIADFLNENNIDYKTQYTYEDCVNEKGNKLRFDFAIIKNGKVFYLLEYDGKQHFESVEYFGGEENFELRKKYDSIKNKYCKENNIPLLRLPYYLSNEQIKTEITNIIYP